jgi:hypothetical protein
MQIQRIARNAQRLRNSHLVFHVLPPNPHGAKILLKQDKKPGYYLIASVVIYF